MIVLYSVARELYVKYLIKLLIKLEDKVYINRHTFHCETWNYVTEKDGITCTDQKFFWQNTERLYFALFFPGFTERIEKKGK